jgi:hypothetical protein
VHIGNSVTVGEDHPMNIKPVCQRMFQLRQGEAIPPGYAFVACLP